MIRSIPNKDWVSHGAIFLVWLLQIILLTAYLPPLSAGRWTDQCSAGRGHYLTIQI